MIKVVFMGTPQIAVNSIQKLLNFNDIKICAVVTQPDRPCGRGKKLTPPPVKEFALRHDIPVFQTESIRKDANLLEELRKIEPDFFITFAFGQILTQDVLDIPKFSTINLHASLLPKYRGANPIQRAIFNGDEETGITTMITVLALDAGDICLQEKIKITENMTDAELSTIISDKSPFLLYPTIKQLYNGVLKPRKQDETGVTIAKKFEKSDGKIDWTKSAREIHNQVRSMTIWPCAFCSFHDKMIKLAQTALTDKKAPAGTKFGEIIGISKEGIEVGTGEGVILIKKLKPEGKPVMNACDWVNGAHLKVGDILN